MKYSIFIFLLIYLLFTSACKKEETNITPVDATLNAEIILVFSENIAYPSYLALGSETEKLNNQIHGFRDDRSAFNMTECRQTWKNARMYWEQTEAFLFGPVASENIDPRIDTWPVNFTDLEAQLNSKNDFSDDYIDNLEDALKGFHPIEYLLFGEDGRKTADEFTDREFEFLEGLSKNLKILTGHLKDNWDPAEENSFYYQFINAGDESDIYTTQQEAFEEMINAMTGICEEVADGKMSAPFNQQDPSLEESPYSGNSIVDFTNNIKGIRNVYLGKFLSDGTGMEDLVRKSDLSLDGEIKLKIEQAIASLGNVTDPFGKAIFTQPVQVQNAIDAIGDLAELLENDLLPFILQHVD